MSCPHSTHMRGLAKRCAITSHIAGNPRWTARGQFDQGVDLASRRGLGNGSGECLARCRAAARVGVIAYSGHSSPCRLRVHARGGDQEDEQCCCK
jgi:hypothetical protein